MKAMGSLHCGGRQARNPGASPPTFNFGLTIAPSSQVLFCVHVSVQHASSGEGGVVKVTSCFALQARCHVTTVLKIGRRMIVYVTYKSTLFRSPHKPAANKVTATFY